MSKISFSDSMFSQEFQWKKKQSVGIAKFPDMFGTVGIVCFLLYPVCSHLCFLWEAIVTKLFILSSGYFRKTSRLYDESSSFSLGILFVLCRNQTAPLSISYCFPKIAIHRDKNLSPWNYYFTHKVSLIHIEKWQYILFWEDASPY